MTRKSNSLSVTRVFLRQSIGSLRLVILLFTVTAAVIKVLYNRYLPELADLEEMCWTIIALGFVLFGTTFLRYKRGLIVNVFSLVLYLCTLFYVIAFALMNQFDPNAVIVLILVVGASSVIINSLFYYGVQSAIIMLASFIVYSNASLSNEKLIAFLNLILALAVFAIVITVRLRLISTVRNSQSNLEKLNVLSIMANKSGEIVFASPSVRNLLGYEPKALMKDGWWKSRNLRNGWINREYILNYPNILPKEIMSIETTLVTKEGKQVWFSWVNSILPNGNYVGVGLDITKYKSRDLTASSIGR